MKRQRWNYIVIATIICMVITGLGFRFGKKADPIPITLEELSRFDGKDGRKAYVAVDGLIYDLSRCKHWRGGVHSHSPEEGIAGRDLTELLKQSTHGIDRVKRYPSVGYLVEEKPESGQP